ncbi:MAG: lamin tail domain-containing protein [Planctomycetota bacterium]
MKTELSIIALAAAAGLASASIADLRITEAYPGIDGEDGTADWIELTNTGASDVDLSGLFYDDGSLTSAAGGTLKGRVLGAGKSIIVIVDVDAEDQADAVAEFAAVWGSNIRAFATVGGGLSQNGENLGILDAFDNIITQVTLPGVPDGNTATVAFDFAGNPSLSALGVNGAFESNAFFDDDAPGVAITLIGSPVPAPAAAGLLGLAGLAASRRRRA